MSALSIINMNHSRKLSDLTTNPRAEAAKLHLLCMDILGKLGADAYIKWCDAGPDKNAKFAQYVKDAHARLFDAPRETAADAAFDAAAERDRADTAALDCGKVGEPLTYAQAQNIRRQHAEFRTNGGVYNNTPKQ